MLNFLCFFVLFNAVKTDTKLTLHHMGNFLFFNFKIKFKIWRVTFLKSFLPLKEFGMDFRFSRKSYHERTGMRQSLIEIHRLFALLTTIFILYYINPHAPAPHSPSTLFKGIHLHWDQISGPWYKASSSFRACVNREGLARLQVYACSPIDLCCSLCNKHNFYMEQHISEIQHYHN